MRDTTTQLAAMLRLKRTTVEDLLRAGWVYEATLNEPHVWKSPIARATAQTLRAERCGGCRDLGPHTMRPGCEFAPSQSDGSAS